MVAVEVNLWVTGWFWLYLSSVGEEMCGFRYITLNPALIKLGDIRHVSFTVLSFSYYMFSVNPALFIV